MIRRQACGSPFDALGMRYGAISHDTATVGVDDDMMALLIDISEFYEY